MMLALVNDPDFVHRRPFAGRSRSMPLPHHREGWLNGLKAAGAACVASKLSFKFLLILLRKLRYSYQSCCVSVHASIPPAAGDLQLPLVYLPIIRYLVNRFPGNLHRLCDTLLLIASQLLFSLPYLIISAVRPHLC